MSSKLLIEGISDAVGFVGGALIGFWVGRWLGLDLFAPGYGNASIGAIVLVSIGGGVGLQLARKWRNRNAAAPKE
ncbi:hypothetical protein [Rhodoferax sp.]|jgi:hypothetical protein|uniref:hypothetical protein n=1 Tax=Rhodoferax sp. TaxID=50421 RepID=UPI0025D5C26D|nr:hypothetical protein [Rhodoferax sp.]